MRQGMIKDLESQGVKVDSFPLNHHQRASYVMKKIVEEAQEAADAFHRQDGKTLHKELADLKEAFETFLSLASISLKEIEKIQQEKQEKLGDYHHGLGVHSITLSSDHPLYNHYKDDHRQYAETSDVSWCALEEK